MISSAQQEKSNTVSITQLPESILELYEEELTILRSSQMRTWRLRYHPMSHHMTKLRRNNNDIINANIKSTKIDLNNNLEN